MNTIFTTNIEAVRMNIILSKKKAEINPLSYFVMLYLLYVRKFLVQRSHPTDPSIRKVFLLEQ